MDLPLDTMFSHPRLGELAKLAEDQILAEALPESPVRNRQHLPEDAEQPS